MICKWLWSTMFSVIFSEIVFQSRDIHQIISFLNNSTIIKEFATYLTGEDVHSNITTRQSWSKSGLDAGKYIQSQFDTWGFKTTLFNYKPLRSFHKFNPNVIAEWPNSGLDGSDELVIIGAHYDDRQRNLNSPTDRAPGANDDGSGTSMLLQLGKWISEQGISFNKRVQIVAFTGEEQGLYGSYAYAQHLKINGVKVIGMIQGDMLAYNPDPTKRGIAFVKGYTTLSMTIQMKEIISNYVPELIQSDSNACCSDHQSFYSAGFPAVGFVEPGGYVIDPEYHSPNDIVNRPGYDLEQILLITKAIAACLCEIAFVV